MKYWTIKRSVQLQHALSRAGHRAAGRHTGAVSSWCVRRQQLYTGVLRAVDGRSEWAVRGCSELVVWTAVAVLNSEWAVTCSATLTACAGP